MNLRGSKEGDWFMTNKGPAEVCLVFQDTIDLMINDEIRIYTYSGHLTSDVSDHNAWKVIYKMTKESHPEYFL